MLTKIRTPREVRSGSIKLDFWFDRFVEIRFDSDSTVRTTRKGDLLRWHSDYTDLQLDLGERRMCGNGKLISFLPKQRFGTDVYRDRVFEIFGIEFRHRRYGKCRQFMYCVSTDRLNLINLGGAFWGLSAFRKRRRFQYAWDGRDQSMNAMIALILDNLYTTN